MTHRVPFAVRPAAPNQSVSGLEDHLGYWLRFASNHVSHAFRLKVEARGITVAEWAVMRAMLRPGPLNPSQLAEQLGMTRGAISKLIDRLYHKRLVDRDGDRKDRRFQRVALTALGRRLVPALAKLADENETEMFGHWPVSTRDELAGMLRGLVAHHGWKDIPVD